MGKLNSINNRNRKRWFLDYIDGGFSEREKSISQPNLGRLDIVGVLNYPFRDRFGYSYSHEYISVDDLNYYRKRRPDCYAAGNLKSHFALYNHSEPAVSYASCKTEYRNHFQEYDYEPRPPLARRHTTLRIESGIMNRKSENRSMFLAYSKESIAKSRPPPIKHSENLKAFEGITKPSECSEYRSSFLPYKLTDFLNNSKNLIKRNSKMVKLDVNDVSCADSTLHNKKKFENTSLKLPDKTMLEPEYKNKYIEYAIEKSQSTPQLNNIKFNGNFGGIPSEYKECYKSYDNFTKSAPIKKMDNLCLSGMLDYTPEYTHRFQNPLSKRFERSSYLKRNDNLYLDGEFINRMPEYCSSYQNPNITQKPEKAKPEDTILHLDGGMSYDPLYRCSYIDFPRRRPISIKPESNIKIATSDLFEHEVGNGRTPRSKHRSKIPVRNQQHASMENELIEFTSQPEYRKAKREILIKVRPVSYPQKSILAQKILDEKHNVGLPQDGYNVSTKVVGDGVNHKLSEKSPTFKFMLDKVDEDNMNKNFDGSSGNHKNNDLKLSRFGNGKSVPQWNQSNIIEANASYAKKVGDQYRKYHFRK
ncbi:uncharacterized protein LOC131689389 isoform X2 [Topomyia yanbarensis]|uniref:uncharacterized protein LOC131689389 isoform X2 n=1 Tax=Topomyia yanbarensis TaxID=2498891 RepID=UPI00273B7F51|nr:uncharacterized protein LOC131689389 isoform X2 [Topomyia yanbarensis]